MRTILSLLFAVSIVNTAIAQMPATLAIAPTIGNIQYTVTFDSSTAASKTVKVEMSFSASGAGQVLLSLPAWTPGAYEITNFAKWVSNFDAAQNGKAIKWDKSDFDTWRVRPTSGGKVAVSFDYYADSLDNAMAWSQPDFLLFNGTNLFLYPENQSLNFPATVIIKTHAGWNVATGMNGSSITRAYTASNYHDLVDMPFFVGEFDIDSAQVSDKWIRYATYPKGSVSGNTRTKLWNDIKRIIPPQVAVFGETGWHNYTILQIANSEYGGASGLEHQNSHVDIITPLALGSPMLPSLYAHEIFHAWNVKRLRPTEIWPYKYDKPQPTTLLWISEGVTDYYADISEVRGGVITRNEFYRMTADKITEVSNTVPVSLEDASLNTWIHPTDGTDYVYYPKGSVAGLLLDIMIRDASNNKASLDNVMRDLYNNTYKRGNGFTNEQFWRAVTTSATTPANGKSFQSFYDRHIDGRDPYPYAEVFKLAGIKFFADTAREPRLGVSTGPDSAGARVLSIAPNGTAAAAGVRIGDVIVAVGDVSVTDPSFGVKFRSTYGSAAAGSPITIRVRRGSETVSLNGTLRFVESMRFRLEDDPNATEKAARIRNSLLGAK